MLTVSLQNFRGCHQAELVCDPIALVGGPNASGKSSIAQATGAALAGDALPIDGLSTANAGLLVRTGAAEALVTVTGDGGSITMAWPAARAAAQGERPPESSDIAAGLESVALMTPKERARTLVECLQAMPTREDLAAALDERHLPGDLIASVWKLIEQQGWDNAHAIRKDRGADLKGRWRQLTTQNYGSRVAAAWRPDLADLNEGELKAAIERAKREVERAISAAAVSQAEREMATREANLLDERDGEARAAEAVLADLRQIAGDAQRARQALPPSEQPVTISCPYCSGPIIVERELTGLRLVRPDPQILDNTIVKERRMAIAEADGRLAAAQDKLNVQRRLVTDRVALLQRSQEAAARLADWPAAVETGTDAEAARTALQRAEKRLAEYNTKREADELHQQIEANDVLLDILAPDGLRAAKLGRALGLFRDRLAALTSKAGWQHVGIDEAMRLSLAGRPYGLLSASEQFRVRAVLQIGMACLDGSDLIVIDGADILDAPTRSGLFMMLDAACIPALVCLTLSRKSQMPDLAEIGLGRSYWLEAGEAALLSAAAEAAA